MGILQLINIVLFWLFFGYLASYFAKKRGRNPRIWFCLGFFLALIGVLLVLLLPKKNKPAILSQATPLKIQRSEAWLKMWYYLDDARKQQGPMEFPDLIKNWREKTLSEKTLVWGEGMEGWTSLSELPDLVKEIKHHSI